jgi:hypothetical protein
MVTIKRLLGIYFSVFFISCAATAQENPAVMFEELYEIKRTVEYESRKVESTRDDGIGMFIYDVNKRLSNDVFCQVELPSVLGQTIYWVYKKDGENIWYIHKMAMFYEAPYELENAEIQDTYFKIIEEVSYAFNEDTGKYDIQADTNRYPSYGDVRSLVTIIEIVEDAVSR